MKKAYCDIKNKPISEKKVLLFVFMLNTAAVSTLLSSVKHPQGTFIVCTHFGGKKRD